MYVISCPRTYAYLTCETLVAPECEALLKACNILVGKIEEFGVTEAYDVYPILNVLSPYDLRCVSYVEADFLLHPRATKSPRSWASKPARG